MENDAHYAALEGGLTVGEAGPQILTGNRTSRSTQNSQQTQRQSHRRTRSSGRMSTGSCMNCCGFSEREAFSKVAAYPRSGEGDADRGAWNRIAAMWAR